MPRLRPLVLPTLLAFLALVSWSTLAHLAPGTYAYFCRVQPFMRGAFRVKG
jgi:hypothetical protein